MELYDVDQSAENRILSITLGPTRFNHASALLADGRVVIMSGAKGTVGETKDTELFDPVTNQLTAGPALNQAHSLAASVSLNGDPIVCGGKDVGGVTVNTCEKLVTINQQLQWQTIGALKVLRYRHGMVEAKGHVYVFGGYNTVYLSSVERYDPCTNTWQLVAPMKTARHSPGVAELNGMVYVCGGYLSGGHLTVCEKYDPETDQWTTVQPLQQIRQKFAMASINGKLYAAGGRYDYGIKVESYNPATDTWTYEAPMKITRSYFTAIVLKQTYL